MRIPSTVIVSTHKALSEADDFVVAVPGQYFTARWSDDDEELELETERGNRLTVGASWLTFDLPSGGVLSRVQLASMRRGAPPTRADRVPSWVLAWNADRSRFYGLRANLLHAAEVDWIATEVEQIETMLSEQDSIRDKVTFLSALRSGVQVQWMP